MTTQTISKDVTIVHKAYQIDLDRLSEGYLSDIIMCYAENLNKAKSILLEKIKYDNWKLAYSNDEVNYLNIPVIRRKSDDKIIFEGSEATKNQVSDIIYERERIAKIDEILNNQFITYCYIYKSGQGYYRENKCGYTYLKHEAGIYEKQDAACDAKSVKQLSIQPIDVEEHNKLLNDKINELTKKLIS